MFLEGDQANGTARAVVARGSVLWIGLDKRRPVWWFRLTTLTTDSVPSFVSEFCFLASQDQASRSDHCTTDDRRRDERYARAVDKVDRMHRVKDDEVGSGPAGHPTDVVSP
jgi:hypothetical protein